MYLHGTSKINEYGHLEIGNCDTVELVKRFGTPLYVYDEQLIRDNINSYKSALENKGVDYQIAYASKAFSTLAMCRLIAEENLSLDVVSAGELYTAVKANFPTEKIFFHGNNKTIDEIAYAIEVGVGYFVVDNFLEMDLINSMAIESNKIMNVLLRTTPGVEAHTHDYISTGQQDSKFGFDLPNNQIKEAIAIAKKYNNLNILGLHFHIGSQIFGTEGFKMAVERVVQIYAWSLQELGLHLGMLNIGGGFGIRYTNDDRPLSIETFMSEIIEKIKSQYSLHNLTIPEIVIEPGRSIVGLAGTTLYTVGTSKEIPEVRKYIAVDGGMTDNPRPALYQARYEATIANRAQEKNDRIVSISGKCCESADMLIWDVELPKTYPGDILAVSCTGAFNYSMASNYNRIPKPAVVFVKDGKADLIVKRESLDDIIRFDVLPQRMLSLT